MQILRGQNLVLVRLQYDIEKCCISIIGMKNSRTKVIACLFLVFLVKNVLDVS